MKKQRNNPVNLSRFPSGVRDMYLSLKENEGLVAANRYLEVITSEEYLSRNENVQKIKAENLTESEIRRIKKRLGNFTKVGSSPSLNYCCVCLSPINKSYRKHISKAYCSNQCACVGEKIKKGKINEYSL